MKFIRSGFLLPESVYTVMALVLLPAFRYVPGSADLFQYLQIGQLYLDGDWEAAINPYWSPMVSWLMVPLLATGLDPLLAWKIFQTATGLWVLHLACSLIPASHRWSVQFRLAMIPSILSYALLTGTPDLLMLGGYLLFIKTWLNREQVPDYRIGLIGAGLFMVKGFGFYFFILSVIILTLVDIPKAMTGRHPFRRGGMIIAFFLLFSSPWITLLSQKEGTFTISSSGSYNLSLMGPERHPDVFGYILHPLQMHGSVSMPDPPAFSSWNRPDHSLTEIWNPLRSAGDFIHYMQVVGVNQISIVFFHFMFDPGMILLVLLGIIFFRGRWKGLFSAHTSLLVVAASTTLLYSFVLVMKRYVWINDIAILILLPAAIRQAELSNFMSRVTATAGIMLAILVPALELVSQAGPNTPVQTAIHSIREMKLTGRTFVSMPTRFPEENYELSSWLAWATGNRYAGIANENNLLHSGDSLANPVMVSWRGWDPGDIPGKRIQIAGTNLLLIDLQNERE